MAYICVLGGRWRENRQKKIWKGSYNADLLNYFKNTIPKFLCGPILIAEYQVEKSEEKGTSCNTKNVLNGPNYGLTASLSQDQQMPKVVARPTQQ